MHDRGGREWCISTESLASFFDGCGDGKCPCPAPWVNYHALFDQGVKTENRPLSCELKHRTGQTATFSAAFRSVFCHLITYDFPLYASMSMSASSSLIFLILSPAIERDGKVPYCQSAISI